MHTHAYDSTEGNWSTEGAYSANQASLRDLISRTEPPITSLLLQRTDDQDGRDLPYSYRFEVDLQDTVSSCAHKHQIILDCICLT